MNTYKPSHLVPKVRFPEFDATDNWKRDRIGNIASISKGKGISKADIANNGLTPCIRYAELYTQYGEIIREARS
ncbi:MAG: restriction endonuclease subunit S, partial [Planctomycetota bacterium]